MFTKLLSFPKKILKLKKRYLIIGGIVILFILFILSRRGANQQPPQFASVKRENLRQQVSASGEIAGSASATLKFPSGGKLASINVRSGDQVTKGEILAELDAQALASDLGKAQNDLRTNQEALNKILDDIHLYQYGNGGFGNVGTPNETETQKNARMSAEAARDNNLETIKADQDALANSVIFAPVSGTITNTPPIAGQTVSAADTIAQISDLSQKEFDADVDESDIGSVKLGQQVEFTLNAYGDKLFKGVVFAIDPITHTNSSGETVVTAKVTANDSSIKSIAGLNGQANIITSERYNVLAVPNDSITSDNKVYVKTPNGLVGKKVKVLFQSDTDSEIEGLNEGDQIVTNPQVVKPQSSRGFLQRFKRG